MAIGCGRDDASPAPPARPPTERVGPDLREPARPAGGPAVTVVYRLEDGLVLRTRGTCALRQAASGTPEPGKPLPASRSFRGSVDLARRIVVEGATIHSRVEGFLRIESQEGPGPALPEMIPISLAFDDDGHGGVVHRTIRRHVSATGLDATGDARPDLAAGGDLEPLWSAFVDRFAPPDRAVRAGDRFEPSEAMALDDVLVRPTWFVFRRAMVGKPMLPKPEGVVSVEAIEGTGPDAVVVLKAAVRHEHEGATDPPPVPKDAVHVAYRATIDATRRLVVDGGWAAKHDVVMRRAFHFHAPAFDYLVETEKSARLETTRGR